MQALLNLFHILLPYLSRAIAHFWLDHPIVCSRDARSNAARPVGLRFVGVAGRSLCPRRGRLPIGRVAVMGPVQTR